MSSTSSTSDYDLFPEFNNVEGEVFYYEYQDNNVDQILDYDSMLNLNRANTEINGQHNNNYSQGFQGMKQRAKYHKGKEANYLKQKFSYYGVPYKHCELYRRLIKTDKKFILEIGEEYNKHFSESIKSKAIPKFKRAHRRNVGLAIWLFQDNIKFVFPWLQSKGWVK